MSNLLLAVNKSFIFCTVLFLSVLSSAETAGDKPSRAEFKDVSTEAPKTEGASTEPKVIPIPTIAAADFSNKPPVDFEELFRRAKEISVDLISLRADKDAAEAKLSATKSAFSPKVGVETRYESFESNIEKKDGGTTNAYVEWNLFNGFRDQSNKVITSVDLKKAENALKRAELNYRWRLLTLYSKTQALQKSIDAYKATIAENQIFLTGVKARKRAGLVSEAELLEFDLYDNKLRLELNEYESEFDLSLGELKTHSGISEFGPFNTELKPKELKIQSSELDGLLSSEMSQLQDLLSDVTKAELELESMNSGYYPQVNLKATHGSQGLRETVKNPETTVAVTAKWELFSGFETSALRKIALTKLSQAQAKLMIEKIHLKSEADQHIKKINNVIARLALEDDNRTKTESYLKAVEQEYRRGVKNSADLKNAAEVLLQSNIKIFLLKSEYYKSRSELQIILGKELEEKN